jgi:hypothetical protein
LPPPECAKAKDERRTRYTFGGKYLPKKEIEARRVKMRNDRQHIDSRAEDEDVKIKSKYDYGWTQK